MATKKRQTLKPLEAVPPGMANTQRAKKAAETRRRNYQREIKIAHEALLIHRRYSDPNSEIGYKPHITPELCERAVKCVNEVAFASGVELPTPSVLTIAGLLCLDINRFTPPV